MQAALAALVALVPPALLLLAVWVWLFRRRCPGIFWTAFGFGVAATLVALLVQLPLLGIVGRVGTLSAVSLAILLAGVSLIEEIAKGGGWYATFGIFGRPLRRDIGIAAGTGAVAALAFAGLENILFNVGATAKLGSVNWDIAAARAGATVPLHATAGLLIGLLAWRIHGARHASAASWIALVALPFLLHAAFNIIQAASGTRQQLGARLDADQWLWIGIAGALVWTVAGLAILYYRRQRRAERRRAARLHAGRGRRAGLQ